MCNLRLIIATFLFLNYCFCDVTQPPAKPTNPPIFEIAQKLLSNVHSFPGAIQDGMAGNTDGIRKIVSTALGGGLIGQLVENPMSAASQFGINLDQFGINKTALEKSMGFADASKMNNFFGKGDVLFSNQQLGPTTTTTTTPEPLIVDGRVVLPENEEAVLSGIFGDKPPALIRPVLRPESHRPDPQSSQSSASYYAVEERQPRPKFQPKKFIPRRNRPTPLPVYPAPPATAAEGVESFDNIPESVYPKMDNNEIFEEPIEIRRAPQVVSQRPLIKQMNAKLLSLEQRLNEQQEYFQSEKSKDKEIKVQKILETLKFGKSGRFSALQKHLRYSPEDEDDLKLDSHPLAKVEKAGCDCVKVTLEQLKGTWFQALSSDLLDKQVKKSIEKLFGSENAKLGCSELQVSPPRKNDDQDYAHFIWTLRLANSTNIVRLPGNIFRGEHNQLISRIVDFDNNVNDVPLCIRHVDDETQHVLIAESQNCKATTLLVKNAEKFFNAKDTDLTVFLRKQISSNRMDRMELVEHVDSCNTSQQ